MAEFLGWVLGTLLFSLVMWTVVPMLVLGWRPVVVVSGSMSPLIRSGDVVMVDTEFESPSEGSVAVFDSGDGLIIHRVVSVEPDGNLITRGDANLQPDPKPVAREDLIGTGRLLIPHLGLIRTISLAWSVPMVAVGVLAMVLWRPRPGISAALVAVLIGLSATAVAQGAFANSTDNDVSTLAAVDIVPPTGLVASCGVIGSGQVEVVLGWDTSSTAEVSGYRVQYFQPGSTNSTPIGTVGAVETTFVHTIDVGLLGVGTHTYAVEALANTWTSEFSNSDAVEITEVLGVYLCTES